MPLKCLTLLKWLYHFTFPTAKYEGSGFFISSTTLALSFLINVFQMGIGGNSKWLIMLSFFSILKLHWWNIQSFVHYSYVTRITSIPSTSEYNNTFVRYKICSRRLLVYGLPFHFLNDALRSVMYFISMKPNLIFSWDHASAVTFNNSESSNIMQFSAFFYYF